MPPLLQNLSTNAEGYAEVTKTRPEFLRVRLVFGLPSPRTCMKQNRGHISLVVASLCWMSRWVRRKAKARHFVDYQFRFGLAGLTTRLKS